MLAGWNADQFGRLAGAGSSYCPFRQVLVGVGVWMGAGGGDGWVVGTLLGPEGTDPSPVPAGPAPVCGGGPGAGGGWLSRGGSGPFRPRTTRTPGRIPALAAGTGRGAGFGGVGGVVSGWSLRTAQWTRVSFLLRLPRRAWWLSGWVAVGWGVVLVGLCGQVVKGTRWMPGHQEPMKDVGGCVKPRGAANRALIRGCPNGGTPHQSCGVTRA